MSTALSRSPPAFSKAALQVIIGMSVRSRSALTAAAEIADIKPSPAPDSRRGGGY
jgi:hypothetical protein